MHAPDGPDLASLRGLRDVGVNLQALPKAPNVVHLAKSGLLSQKCPLPARSGPLDPREWSGISQLQEYLAHEKLPPPRTLQ